MPVLIMTFGSIFTLIGLVLLVRAIFGHQISDHPFCRACRYDLIGLDISSPTPCPECGAAVVINTRSIIKGQRQTRLWLLPIALVIMLVGSVGIGYTSIKRHPSLEYIDWHGIYEQSSEPTLRLYEALNDEDAAHELWRRMTKGKISDKGLRILIDRAIKHIADPSAVYDYRWGGVLLYALYDNQLTDQERTTFIEGSVTSKIHLHALQSNDSDTTYAVISHHGVERFMGSWMTTIPLQLKDRPVNSMRATSDFRIVCTPQILAINGKPLPNQEKWASTSNDWAAINTEFATSRIHIPFPIDQQVLDATIAINYVLMQNDTLVHTWQQTINTSIQRATGPVEHAQHIEDPAIINPILSNLNIGMVVVPTQTDLARQADTRRGVRPALSIQSTKLFDHKLLGDIRFRIGDHQIPYQSIEWNPQPRITSPRNRGRSICYVSGWGWSGSSEFDETLAYFDQHHSFWEEALQVGKVDVLIIPNLKMAEQNPRITSFINRPIIFKDVPVSPLVPRIITRTSSLTGKSVEVLRWSPQNSPTTTRSQPITAAFLDMD
ncbi:MAG: hypothetical protein JKY43_07280 [Phycisphaerales bacterium]|nr:hypothetical protein [Phycisphaerales bacterium]